MRWADRVGISIAVPCHEDIRGGIGAPLGPIGVALSLPCVAGAVADTSVTPPALRLFLAGTRQGAVDVISDGHFNGNTNFSAGVEGDVLCSGGAKLRKQHGPARPDTAARGRPLVALKACLAQGVTGLIAKYGGD